MSSDQQAVKGMNDLLPPDSAKWGFLERRAQAVFERYGYREVRTPIVEYTPLFVRSIGETTDVVSKEMYTFDDRDGRSLTMRPEGTASAVRAYLEHSMPAKEPVTRWYYSGPMFRHERMQRGRYRQFYQMGVEAFGVAEATLDAEQIAMVHGLFVDLGLTGLEVAVNSVGTVEDRAGYKAALAAFLEPHRAQLCADCQSRLDKNPLRVLDCKNERCQAIVATAPSILEHLGEASLTHFAKLKDSLEALEVPYTVDTRLVRGLDYYTGTTFEIRARGGDLGAQNTICGGGRYNNLVAALGGPSTPAVGFAFGLERLALTLSGEAETFEVGTELFFASHGDAARRECLKLAQRLRARGFRVDMEHRVASMKAQLKRADRVAARIVVIIGESELEAGTVVLRDMKSAEQRTVPAGDLVTELKKALR